MNGYNLVRLQPKQVLKTGDTMSGNLTMTGGAKFIGDLTGNADTATQLETARNITVGNETKQFDGSKDISFSFQALGAVNANGYWGMAQPNLNDNEWIRTTEKGIIPYSSNGVGGYSTSNTDIGQNGWRFRNIYARNGDYGGTMRIGGIITAESRLEIAGGAYFNNPNSGGNANGWAIGTSANYSYIVPTFDGANQLNRGIRYYPYYVAGGTFEGESFQISSNIVPNNSTTFKIGHTNARWQDVYCTRGAFNGSDSKLKENIKQVSRENLRTFSDEVTSHDFYNYVKDCRVSTFNYKRTSENFVGIIADDIPDNVFSKIGVMSKTDLEYKKEVEEFNKFKSIFEEKKDSFTEEDYKENIFIDEAGLTLLELKEASEKVVEQPVRIINAPAQVAMLQEVLSMALEEIEQLKNGIKDLKSNGGN